MNRKFRAIILLGLTFFTLCALNHVFAAGKTLEEQYQEKLSKIKDGDAKGHYDLGRWCKQNKLTGEAQAEFQKTIELKSDHEGARKELGYIKYKNRWIKPDEKSSVDYEEKLAKLKDDDAKGHYDLGLWCLKNKLPDNANTEFEKTVQIDPEHKDARKALNHVKYNDKWVTKEEYDEITGKEKGYVKYGNQWLPPKEMESLREKERGELKWDFECKIQTRHYLIYSSTSEEESKTIANVMECLYDSFMKTMGGMVKSTAKDSIHKICLFTSEQEFRQKVPQAGGAYGYYEPYARTANVIYKRDKWIVPYTNCLHEGTHQLVEETMNALFPSWLSEGLACYFESSKLQDNKLILGDVDIYTNPGTWFAFDANKLGSKIGNIETYLSMSRREWLSSSGSVAGEVNYRTCWMLIHFLFHYQDGLYKDKFFKCIEKATKSGVNEKDFEELIEKTGIINGKLPEYIEAVFKDKKKTK